MTDETQWLLTHAHPLRGLLSRSEAHVFKAEAHALYRASCYYGYDLFTSATHARWSGFVTSLPDRRPSAPQLCLCDARELRPMLKSLVSDKQSWQAVYSGQPLHHLCFTLVFYVCLMCERERVVFVQEWLLLHCFVLFFRIAAESCSLFSDLFFHMIKKQRVASYFCFCCFILRGIQQSNVYNNNSHAYTVFPHGVWLSLYTGIFPLSWWIIHALHHLKTARSNSHWTLSFIEMWGWKKRGEGWEMCTLLYML